MFAYCHPSLRATAFKFLAKQGLRSGGSAVASKPMRRLWQAAGIKARMEQACCQSGNGFRFLPLPTFTILKVGQPELL